MIVLAAAALLLAQGTPGKIKVRVGKDASVSIGSETLVAGGAKPDYAPLLARFQKEKNVVVVELDVEAETPVEIPVEVMKRAYQGAGAICYQTRDQVFFLRNKEMIQIVQADLEAYKMGEIVVSLCSRGKPGAHGRPEAHLKDASKVGELSAFVEKIDLGAASTPQQREALFARIKERAGLLKDAMPKNLAHARVECCPGVSFDDLLRALAVVPQPFHLAVLGLGEPEGIQRPAPKPGLEPGQKILELDK